MGREIIIQARYNDNVIYEDYVCGRDDATSYIANLVCNYCKEHNLDTNEITYDCSSDTQTNNLEGVKKQLQGYLDKDTLEINKARSCLEDLKCARRNTTTVKNFDEFTERCEEVEQWIEDNDWSRAGSLIEMINLAKEKLVSCAKSYALQHTMFLRLNKDLPPKVFIIAIIWSE